MPVRIYDIAKRLGIESKEVLARAKELGITNVRVPSSSLDKITAEYLEKELSAGRVLPLPPPPPPPPPPPAAPPITPSPPPEPLERTAPAVEPTSPGVSLAPTPVPASPPLPVATPVGVPVPEPAAQAPPISVPTVPLETSAACSAPTEVAAELPVREPVAQAGPPADELRPAPVAETLVPSPVEVPAPPKAPQLGEKIGFIQLPPKPAPRVGDRIGFVKLPAKPGPPAKPIRGPIRAAPPSVVTRPVFKAYDRGMPAVPATSPTPVPPKFVPPTTGELITLKPPIMVRDLAERLGQKPFRLIADLIELNVFANVNQSIDEAIAQRVCAKYGFRFEVEKRERGGGLIHAPARKVELDVDDKPEDLRPRPPVVTIMGHVDHGKTTLLDVVRKSNVAAGEAGGITQHIGAYTIAIPHPDRPKDLQQITFLDTPGHAAFSAMRARGANVTDVVILVVAANEGVMPQTLEALNHARAAKVPTIVAVNKCDHPHANPMRVRQQLQDKGLVSDEWGGDTIFVDVSALTKHGVDRLLGLLVLQAEVLELKANPSRRAKGNVIESGLEPGGPTATVLVRKGTLRVGDILICGPFWGKVRALINEEGRRLKEAGPSVAVRVLGLNGVPEAGLEFSVVENDKNARLLAEQRNEALKAQAKDKRPKITLENLFEALAADSAKILKVVVKADAQGSIEAIVEALKKIDSTKVALEIIHSAVGTITESDVLLAAASKAIILGFHTRIDSGVPEVAKREAVQIKQYTIIYELIDQVKDAMAGLLEPETREVVLGAAEVRQIFSLSKGGNVAGCMVSSGRITKGKVRILRRKEAIHEGVIHTLRRFQDEVNEVRAGLECGIRISSFEEYQPGDVIESFTLEKVTPKL